MLERCTAASKLGRKRDMELLAIDEKQVIETQLKMRHKRARLVNTTGRPQEDTTRKEEKYDNNREAIGSEDSEEDRRTEEGMRRA